MSVEIDLRNGVFNRIKTANILTVVWPNTDKNVVKPYLRVFVLSTPTDALGIKSRDLYEGFIQVDVVVASGVGEIVALEYGAQVLDLFPRNFYLTENTTEIGFIKKGSPGPALQETDGDGYFIPFSIPYVIIN